MRLLEGLLLEPPLSQRIPLPLIDGYDRPSSLVALVETYLPHGLQNGDSVEIRGAIGAGAQWWNGVFVVFDVSSHSFKYQMFGSPPETYPDITQVKGYKLTPAEYFISARTDGVIGGGTITDPFNGTARAPSGEYAPLTITSLQKGGTGNRTATAVTQVDHNFKAGDWVTIVGVDCPYAIIGITPQWYNCYYMGTFQVTPHATDPKKFTYVMLAEPPASSAVAENTKISGMQCWKERERFDQVLRSIPGGSVIHVSEGLFETKGAIEPSISGGWVLRTGSSLFGSGMGRTVLKLVSAFAVPAHNQATAVVYNAILDENKNLMIDRPVAAADFTVDCNADGQASLYCCVGAIAFRFGGWQHRIRNVEALRWGSMGPLAPWPNPGEGFGPAYNENWPIWLAAEGLVDGRIEDCVARASSPNAMWNSSVLMMGGGPGFAMRNNFVDGSYVYGKLAQISSIQLVTGSTTKLEVTTRSPHGLSTGDNVHVTGIRVNGSTDTGWNGVFKVLQKSSDTVFVYEAFSGDNISGTRSLDENSYVGRPVSPWAIAFPVWGISSVGTTRKRFAVTTVIPHNLTTNNRVSVGAVGPVGVSAAQNPCSGCFPVVAVNSRTQFEYETHGTVPGTGAITFEGHPFINLQQIFTSADNGTGAVVEGNRLLHGATAGPWHDTGDTTDLIARYNYYYDIANGPTQSFLNWDILNGAISITKNGKIATYVSNTPFLGLVPGRVVSISGARISGSTSNPFNGYFVVRTVENTTVSGISVQKFTYEMGSEPTSDVNNIPRAVKTGLDPVEAESLTYYSSGGGFRARFKSWRNHNFSDESTVTISNAFVPGINPYNRSDVVIDWESETVFTYPLETDPGANALIPLLQRTRQVKNWVIEKNVILTGGAPPQGYWPQPTAIIMVSPDQAVPYVFRNAIIHRNFISQTVPLLDPGWHTGVTVRNAETFSAHENIFDVDSSEPFNSKSKYFSDPFINTTLKGRLVEARNELTGLHIDEAASLITDALFLSI